MTHEQYHDKIKDSLTELVLTINHMTHDQIVSHLAALIETNDTMHQHVIANTQNKHWTTAPEIADAYQT